MVLSSLVAAIDELAGVDPSLLADADTFAELHRQLDRFEAVVTRAAGAFDAAGIWRLDKARSAASWITGVCHRPHSAAKAEIALARALRHLPVAEQAWSAGAIGAAHVRAVARVRRPATEDRLAQDEEVLIGHATDLQFRHFTRVVAYWAQHADPDVEDERALDQLEQRRLHLSQSFGDIWFMDGVFDPINGSIVANELSRLEQELFDADWAEARRRVGREPNVVDLARTPEQRRADALVEMATRSATAPAEGGVPRRSSVFSSIGKHSRAGSANWPTAPSSPPVPLCRG